MSNHMGRPIESVPVHHHPDGYMIVFLPDGKRVRIYDKTADEPAGSVALDAFGHCATFRPSNGPAALEIELDGNGESPADGYQGGERRVTFHERVVYDESNPARPEHI
jgi:hypothetical protein